MKKQLLILVCSIFISNFLFATHNAAGEIIFKQINSTTVEASIITYTKASSAAADRDTLEICWGDGSCEFVGRVNGPNNSGEIIGPDTKMNIYTKVHTYAGQGHYEISMTDPNRNAGILNVNWPNSENVPFAIMTELNLFNPVINGLNNSPVLLQPPIDAAFTGEPFMHTPNAFDIDGDSIAYELIAPIGVPDYMEVTEVMAGPNNTLTMNEETGLLVWDAPQLEGLYTIAYLVKSYRNGEEIDRMIRDMQIEVEEGPGLAPEITMANVTGNEEIILVDLGDTVRLEVTASDSDADQVLAVTATCGLFDFFNSTADFSSVTNGNSATATFEWIVKEEHLREQPYELVIKAEDNTNDHFKSKLAVVRFKTSTITSVPEPATSRGIKLFPNPVNEGYFSLYFKNHDLFPKQYLIFNSLGQQMSQGIINTELTEIRVDTLSKGVYRLLIEDGKTQVVSSFVVQ